MPLFIIPATALADIFIIFPQALALRLAGGALLFCFLPGLALLHLLFICHEDMEWLEKGLLSVGASYLLSNLTLLAAHFLPGRLTLLHLLVPLNLEIAVLLGLAFLRQDRIGSFQRSKADIRTLTAERFFPSCLRAFVVNLDVLALLLLVLFFRFASLGYSEFQGDETDVSSLARWAILGDDGAFFQHKKGPVELTTTAAFALLSGGFNEGALRFPFALASAAAVMASYLIARGMFGRDVAFLAGVLLAIEGVFLGFSRIVQYHGVEALMLALAFYCFYRMYELENGEWGMGDGEWAARYQILGALFFSLGLLTHYEAAPMGLVLAFLYFRLYGRHFIRKNGRVLLLSVGLALAPLLAYYLPFALQPDFPLIFERYARIRISPEHGPYNNLGFYAESFIFYNSIYYAALMAFGLLVCGARSLLEATQHRKLALALALFLVVGGAVSVAFPDSFILNGVRGNIALFLPLLIAFALFKLPAGQQGLFLWFFLYLIIYSFLIRVPGLHYYTLSPAWAVLAAWGIGSILRRAKFFLVPALTLMLAVSAFYTYILFVRTEPEYALSYPENRISFYWNTHTSPPKRFFGFPHKSGWKVIGYLYRTGELKGTYRSNEKKEITRWYTHWEQTDKERPTYYFIAANATEKPYEQDYPRELIHEEYRLVGKVFVRGKPWLEIYELKGQAPAGAEIVRYDVEKYEGLYDEMLSTR